MVSFTVEDSSLDFDTVNTRISLSTKTLSMLNFNIINISRGKSPPLALSKKHT